jgi:hypothetical protein
MEVGREASRHRPYLASHDPVGFVPNLSLETLMAQTSIYLGPLPTRVFVLMDGSNPVEAYLDKDLAHYDCWICNEAEKFSPDPMPFYVKEAALQTATYSPVEA